MPSNSDRDQKSNRPDHQKNSNLGDRFHQKSIFEFQSLKDNVDRVSCPQSNKTKDETPNENSMNQTESSSNIGSTLTRKQTAES